MDTTTGLAVITVDDTAENTIIVVPGANALVDGDYVDRHAATISDAAVVLLQGEIPASGFTAAVRHARDRVVINLAPVIEVPVDALLAADPLIANEHEAGLILAQLGAEVPATPTAMASALIDAGFSSVILTLGEAGALVASSSSVETVPSPQVKAVDTTGAGDAFAGALVARLASGSSLIDAAHHAVRVAAYAVTGPGAQTSYPGQGEQLP